MGRDTSGPVYHLIPFTSPELMVPIIMSCFPTAVNPVCECVCVMLQCRAEIQTNT